MCHRMFKGCYYSFQSIINIIILMVGSKIQYIGASIKAHKAYEYISYITFFYFSFEKKYCNNTGKL